MILFAEKETYHQYCVNVEIFSGKSSAWELSLWNKLACKIWICYNNNSGSCEICEYKILNMHLGAKINI